MKWFLLISVFYGPYKANEWTIQQPNEKACYAAKDVMNKQIQVGAVNAMYCVPGEMLGLPGMGGK